MIFRKKGCAALLAALITALVLAGCGAAEEPQGTDSQETGTSTVSVSNVDEFLAAIAPHTEIRLEPGVYRLTDAQLYGKADASDYYRWKSYGFDMQYELYIAGVDGLSIVGEEAEIVTVPRCANVLAFENCDDLCLQGLTVGHTVEAEACEGGVIWLNGCDRVAVEKCSLYGCGTIGVVADNCSDVKVNASDIYHCSSSGVYLYETRNAAVENCRIYDCGASDSSFYAVFSATVSYGVRIADCEIFDNRAYALFAGYGLTDAEVSGLNIHDNRFSTVFPNVDGAVFRTLDFRENIIDKWLGEPSWPIELDGKTCSEEELSARWGDQLSSSGIGTADVDFRTAERENTREVHVKTADEFLAAIASDTVIYIDADVIDLTTASDYGDGAKESDAWSGLPVFGGSSYIWRWVYDGYELCIGNVSNLHIVGGEVVTQPRYANVLNLYYCDNVSLENVYLGHTPEQGVCCGGVLYLDSCSRVLLESCDLYGCGILGISTNGVADLAVQRTRIHDCSQGAAMLWNSDEVVFLECTVENCPDPHFSLQNCTGFSWDRTMMDPNVSFNVD